MENQSKVLVSLKLNDQDEAILDWAIKNLGFLNPQKLFLIHNIEPFNIPREVAKNFTALEDQFKTERQRQLQEISSTFTSMLKDCTVSTKVHIGNTFRNILSDVYYEGIDFLVLGRRSNFNNINVEKLTRKAPCSVFVVPKSISISARSILVAVDFENEYLDAMATAIRLASSHENGHITCVRIYDLPNFFSESKQSSTQFETTIRDCLDIRFKQFVHKFQTGKVQIKPLFLKANSTTEGLLTAIEKTKPSLLVMGASARNELEAFLLGHTPEQMLNLSPIPLLTVKKKGSGQSFLQSIFGW